MESGDPARQPRFWLGRTEVTVQQYCAYLNEVLTDAGRSHPQAVRRQGRFFPARGQARRPVAHVSHAEASAYCAWLSQSLGYPARLPRPAEWALAARGGRTHAAYPWGWGSPRGKARFHADGPANVGRYAPNPFGLYDLAGNLFEWCAPDTDAPSSADACSAAGGSWAETDPFLLTIDRVTRFPCDYRDADVGFRVLVETPPMQ